MSLEAQYLRPGDQVEFVAAADLVSGQVIQHSDGRAAVVSGLKGFLTSEVATAYVAGIFLFKKKNSQAFTDGQLIWWDNTLNQADDSGDWILGRAQGAAATAATTAEIALNADVDLTGVNGFVEKVTAYSGAGSTYIWNAACPVALMLVDMFLICTDGVTGTVKVTNGTNDLTNDLTHGNTDKGIVRAGTIDDAYSTIAAAGTAKVVATTGGSGLVVTRWAPAANIASL